MLSNYKTTIAGFLVAALYLWSNGLSMKHFAVSAGFAAFGAIARDWNVSSEASGAKGGI